MSALSADPWLSERLGKTAYRADPGASSEDLREALESLAPEFVFAKIDAEEISTLSMFESHGFRVIDVNVSLDAPATTRVSAPPANARISTEPPADVPALLQVAATSFRYSRFHLDPAVPNAAADAIKRDWVENYVLGTRGDRLFVAEVDGAPAGFLAALTSGDAAVIDLIGVSPAHQRAGVGRELLRAFFEAYGPVTDRFRVGTQVANTPSLRFYQGLGFRDAGAHYVVHRHAGGADENR